MKKAFTAVDKGVKKFTLPRQNIRKTLVDTKRKTLSGHMGLGLNDIKSFISEPKSGSIVEETSDESSSSKSSQASKKK